MDDAAVRALAGLVLAKRDLREVLQEITEIANDAVPGAESTSITLVRGDDAYTVSHVGQMALDADEEQYQRGYGPCMDAGRTGLVLVIDDMRNEQRWPDYASRAVQHGVLSSLSVPLPFQGAVIGALNVYSSTPATFDHDAVAIGEEVAGFIAVAVNNADAHAEATVLAAQMQEAMRSRADIEMAKGILMAQNRCSGEEAFTMLNLASQRSNRKLRDIAAAIVSGVTSGRRDRR